jgi:hypothetical protein
MNNTSFTREELINIRWYASRRNSVVFTVSNNNVYQWIINDAKQSSYQLGKCERCGKHSSNLFTMRNVRLYKRPDGVYSWTLNGAITGHFLIFGHRQYLEDLITGDVIK